MTRRNILLDEVICFQTGRRRRDSGASGTSESDAESHSEGEMVCTL